MIQIGRGLVNYSRANSRTVAGSPAACSASPLPPSPAGSGLLDRGKETADRLLGFVSEHEREPGRSSQRAGGEPDDAVGLPRSMCVLRTSPSRPASRQRPDRASAPRLPASSALGPHGDRRGRAPRPAPPREEQGQRGQDLAKAGKDVL